MARKIYKPEEILNLTVMDIWIVGRTPTMVWMEAWRQYIHKQILTANQLVGILSAMQIETHTRHESKTKFLDAALHVIRAKGYTATRIEDICDAAGLTKGSFFHHFKSKEELTLAAVEHWEEMADHMFAAAPYRALPDPLGRLLAYVDFRKALLEGELAETTCLAGTMVQEVYDTHPPIREACGRSIFGHAAMLESDIAEAMEKYNIDADWSVRSLALYTQAVIQGAFILAKAKHGPQVATDCLDHLRRYLEMLFRQSDTTEKLCCLVTPNRIA